MICRVFDWATDKQLRDIDATPECGVDFCDSCGDCLDCYGGEPCPYGMGRHSWVVYEGFGDGPPDKRNTELVRH